MIKIRKITENDTDNILKWRNDRHVVDFFIDRDVLTRETHINWLKNYVETGKVAQYIIYDEADKKDIGCVYLRDIDHKNKKAEYGIFIGEKDYMGKGVGYDALRQLMGVAFNELGLNKVFGRVLQYNTASYNLALKVGFKQDALLREDVIIDGEAVNVYILSLLKKEWEGYEM